MDESFIESINYDERWEIVMEAYEMLEHKFGYYLNVPNVVACSSGTAALHLALESLQLPPGSEVIIPDFAFIACARAVTLAGLVPIFIDVNSDNLLINLELVEDMLSKHTDESSYIGPEVIIAVHTYGRRCDMNAIHNIAFNYGLDIIEDLAECHGVAPDKRTDVSVWSFHSSKVIHGEEGGALSFRSRLEDKRDLSKCLRSLGHGPLGDYRHTPKGHNYRMSNLHSHAILDSLAIVDRNLEQRRRIENWYNEHVPNEWRMPPRHCPWTYDIRIPGMVEDVQRQVILRLQESGIHARFSFYPLSLQEEYLRCQLVTHDTHGPRNSLLASREIIRLPIDLNKEPWRVHKSARECFDIIRSVVNK